MFVILNRFTVNNFTFYVIIQYDPLKPVKHLKLTLSFTNSGYFFEYESRVLKSFTTIID